MGNREREREKEEEEREKRIVEERKRRIVQLQSRSKVFKAIAEGLVEGQRPNLKPVREFYLQNATTLVPDHDCQIVISRALAKNRPEPSLKFLRVRRALEIFRMDITVARNFAPGIRYGKEGELTSLDDLIKEEQAKLLTLQETEPVVEFRRMEVAGLF